MFLSLCYTVLLSNIINIKYNWIVKGNYLWHVIHIEYDMPINRRGKTWMLLPIIIELSWDQIIA